MGPKNHPSWIDRMCEKLESVYVEVEKDRALFVQETTKYMENQMNVVNTNMKKFCDELVQELLPPSSLFSDDAVQKPDPILHYGIFFSDKPQKNTHVCALKIPKEADINKETSQPTQQNDSIIAKEHERGSETLIEQRECIGKRDFKQVQDCGEILQNKIADETLIKHGHDLQKGDVGECHDFANGLPTSLEEGTLVKQSEHFGQGHVKQNYNSGDRLKNDFAEGAATEEESFKQGDFKRGYAYGDRVETDIEVAPIEQGESFGQEDLKQSCGSGERLQIVYEQGKGLGQEDFEGSSYSGCRLQTDFAEGMLIEQGESIGQEDFNHDSIDSLLTVLTEKAPMDQREVIQQADFRQSHDSGHSLEIDLAEGTLSEQGEDIKEEHSEQSHDFGDWLQDDFVEGAVLDSDEAEEQTVVGENMCSLRGHSFNTIVGFSSISDAGIALCPFNKAEEQMVFGEGFESIVLGTSNHDAGFCSSKDEGSGAYEPEEDHEQSAEWYVREEGGRLHPLVFLNCYDNYYQVERDKKEIETGWEII